MEENVYGTRIQNVKNSSRSTQEMRTRRHEVTVELRKNKKENQMFKRRNINDEDITSPIKEFNGQSPTQLTVDEIVMAMNSTDPDRQFSGTQAARKMLSRERNPPIDLMIGNGIVPICVRFLEKFDNPLLQFEAAWALTNIASGSTEQTRTVIDANAVPYFIALLQSPVINVAEQAVWALGNIAGDGAVARDMVLNNNAVDGILRLIHSDTPISFLRNIVWLMSNLCRNKNPSPPFDKIKLLLPVLSQLLTSNDRQVSTDAGWALSYVTDDDNTKLQAVIDSDAVPRLVPLLDTNETGIIIPALRSVGNIVTGSDSQADSVISAGGLPVLGKLLQSTKHNIVKEAAWTVSNITAGNQNQIQDVINAENTSVLGGSAQAGGSFSETISETIPISLEIDLYDPAVWPDLNDRLLTLLVEKGPKQNKDISYPVKAGRKFNNKHFTRLLSNGETIVRSWLVYSVSTDSIFCFCCKLFMQNSQIAISSIGFNNWNHIIRVLTEHEKGAVHVDCFKKWKEFELRLSKNSTNDCILQNTMSKEVQHWRDVLKRLIILVKFLSVQSLEFRGGSDKLYEKNNGNFLKLVEAIAEFDNVLSEHLGRITNDETQNKYLHNSIQNELISIVSKVIQNKINDIIKGAKYFSIIVDCTPDQSRNEQLSLIVRVLHRNKNKYEIKELFMGFLKATDTTGKGLTDLVLDQLTSLGFSISDCRGQGYDYGSNMKGKNIGMQAQIKHLEPRAFFVPCASHSANLVLLDSVQCSLQAVNFFDTVQCLYVFFSSSVSRWDILKKNVKTLTLKPLCTTRWESRIEALKPLMCSLGNIYDALVEIGDDKDKDGITRNNANSLSLKIIQFEFICSLIIWYNILDKINIFSKYLQSPAICLTTAVNLLEGTKQFLTDLRNDEKFQVFIIQAKEIALKLDVAPNFPDAPRRPSRRPQLFSYEDRDEIISYPEQKFKVEFYFQILDRAIQSVSERFDQISEHNNIFKFLHNISVVSLDASDLLNSCLSLEKHLTFNSNSDIVGLDLSDEIKIFQSIVSGTLSPIESLDFIFEKKLDPILPNLVVALRILLTIPVTVASGERSFSKLKIIKNYLRTTIGQERLVDLARISIESEFLNNLDYSDLVDDFAKFKARKIKFN